MIPTEGGKNCTRSAHRYDNCITGTHIKSRQRTNIRFQVSRNVFVIDQDEEVVRGAEYVALMQTQGGHEFAGWFARHWRPGRKVHFKTVVSTIHN